MMSGNRWLGCGFTWQPEWKGFWINLLTFTLDISRGVNEPWKCTCSDDKVEQLVAYAFDMHQRGCPALTFSQQRKTWLVQCGRFKGQMES